MRPRRALRAGLRAMVGSAAWAALAHAAAGTAGGQGPDAPRPARHGIEFSFDLTLEATTGFAEGGRTTSTGLGLADLVATASTRDLGLWTHGRFTLHAQGIFGGLPASGIGDLQGTSNIEGPETLRLYEGWYEHRWNDGRNALLGGVHDFNSDFAVLDEAALFLQSSFGLGPEISQVQPSTYPLTSLGLRLHASGTHGRFLRVGLYDGARRNAEDPLSEQIGDPFGGGRFVPLEVGVARTAPGGTAGKLALGVWHHGVRYTDFAGRERRNNGGLYVIGERSRPRESGGRIGAFVQLGSARRDRNRVSAYVGAGLQWHGWNPDRGADRVGVALAIAVNGSDYLAVHDHHERAESVVELTYRRQVADWLRLQPDLQLVLDPGEAPQRDAVWVVSIRALVSL